MQRALFMLDLCQEPLPVCERVAEAVEHVFRLEF